MHKHTKVERHSHSVSIGACVFNTQSPLTQKKRQALACLWCGQCVLVYARLPLLCNTTSCGAMHLGRRLCPLRTPTSNTLCLSVLCFVVANKVSVIAKQVCLHTKVERHSHSVSWCRRHVGRCPTQASLVRIKKTKSVDLVLFLGAASVYL